MTNIIESFIDRHRGGERVVLVHIDFKLHPSTAYLQEFCELVDSADLKILSVITGRRTVPEAKYFVGEGKAEEINQTVHALKAEAVIFNHDLTPAQGRNLEKLFNCRVIDRTELILDIFAKRARSFEGKLQVELAQLQHLRTRLVRGWTHLERQKGGIGLRGPGETQLETDRRLVENKIKNIKKRLEKVVTQREQSRRARRRATLPTLSLVGYTNAGKSTLFNRLTQSEVYVADQLFATLDPTLRQIHLPTIGKIILADTVGFIRDLPHDLVAAFRATLEETRQADLLLHVIDAQQEHRQQMIDDVEMILTEIDAMQVPRLQVFNKIDLANKFEAHIDYDERKKPIRVWISAKTGIGMELLHRAITELMSEEWIDCQVILAAKEGQMRAVLYDLKVVINESTDEQGRCILLLHIRTQDYQRLGLAHLQQAP